MTRFNDNVCFAILIGVFVLCAISAVMLAVCAIG